MKSPPSHILLIAFSAFCIITITTGCAGDGGDVGGSGVNPMSTPNPFDPTLLNPENPEGDEGPPNAGPSPNNAPSLTSIEPASVVALKAGEGKHFAVTSYDEDGNQLTLSVKINPFGTNVTNFPNQGISKTSQPSPDPKVKKWEVVVTPPESLIGKSYRMTFTVKDSKGASDTSSPFPFMVKSPGDTPPNLTLKPPPVDGEYQVVTGGSREIRVAVEDADFGDDARLVCTEADGQGNVSYCGWSSTYGEHLVIYHAPGVAGAYPVTFTATPCPLIASDDMMPCCQEDDELACCVQDAGSCTSQTVTFAVSEPPANNHAPSIISVEGLQMKWVPRGCTTSYDVTVLDQDGDDLQLSCSADSFCKYVSFEHVSGNTWAMDITPSPSIMAEKEYQFYIQAHDGTTSSSNKVINVHVYDGQGCP